MAECIFEKKGDRMKKYAAFLRGINISGKNKIPMAELKSGLELLGYQEVSTYLNSGNITFVSDEADSRQAIRTMILDKFGLEIPVCMMEMENLLDILSNSPGWWDSGDKSKYDNLIFRISSETPEELCQMIGGTSEDLEKVQIYKDVIFWTFDRQSYQKCKWWKKTASAGIAEKITIRTANTVKKICRSAGT